MTDAPPAGPPEDAPASGPQPGGRYRIFPAQGQAFPEGEPDKPLSPEDYRAKVLPGLLKSTHDKPDMLHEILVGAIRIGALEEATTGARRLVELQPENPRGVALLSIALLQGKQVEEAERLLREHIAQHGSVPLLRLRLAQALHTKGEVEAAEDELWETLEESPNLPDAVLWWGRIKHAEEEQGGFYRGMQQVDAIEGSWFAKLWMARMHLEVKDAPSALALYEQALPAAASMADAMAMISADLGKAGHFEDVLRLLGPYYDARRHGPGAGLNLAVSCAKTGDADRCRSFLAQVESLGMAHLAPQVARVKEMLES